MSYIIISFSVFFEKLVGDRDDLFLEGLANVPISSTELGNIWGNMLISLMVLVRFKFISHFFIML